MEELKPCPFCGVEPKIKSYTDTFHTGRRTVESSKTYYAECANEECGITVTTEEYLTRRSVVLNWNKRVEA